MSTKAPDTTAARIARIETRLSRLCIALGIDPYGENLKSRVQRIRLMPDNRVEITHLDVSLLDLRQFLTSHDSSSGDYTIYHNGAVVAIVNLP